MAENTDGDLQKIIVLMQAQDRDFRVAMKKNADAMRRMTADGDREFRKLQKQMRAVDRQAWAAAGAMGGWGKSFVAGMAGGVVTAILGGISNDIAGVVKGIASIGDEAKRAGLGVEAFQEWKYVAEQNRIGIDALVDGFKELNLRADEYVVTGAGSAAEAFNRLGYTAADLRDKLKDPSALMLEIIDRLHRVDQAARIRITDELFGGTGGEQLLQLLGMSSDKLREMRQRARDLGLVLEESTVAAAAEIDRKFSEISGRISSMMKSMVVDLADMSEEGAPEFVKLARAFADALDGNGQAESESTRGLQELLILYQRFGAEVGSLAPILQRFSGDLRRMGNTEAADALHEAAQGIQRLNAELDKGKISAGDFDTQMGGLIKKAQDAFAALGEIDDARFGRVIERLGDVWSSLEGLRAKAREVRAAMPGGSPSMDTGSALAVPANPNDLLPPSGLAPRSSPRPQSPGVDSFGDWLDARNNVSSGGGKGGGGSQSEYQRATESIREQTAALEAEAVALLATAESGKEYGDAVQYARRYAELLTAAQEDGRDVTPELRAEIDQLAASYVAAGEGAEAARDKMEAVRESARRGEDALVGIFESVLDGSRSAKDALGDLLMEMAKVQLRQAAMGVFGGSGIGGFLGGMLTPIAGKRASGGSVVGGRPYLVNENTPNSEVFVPSQGGAILTSAQAQEAMRARAVAPAAGRLGAEIRVKIYVEDDGKLAAVASQAGAQAALPVAVEVVKQNNRQQAQAQRRK